MKTITTRRMRSMLHLLAIVGLLAVVTPVANSPSPATAAEATTGSPAPSSGCGTTEQGAVVEEQRFVDVGGAQRWFLVTVPGAHDGDTPLPIVIDFHGLSEGAQIHTLMSEFSPIAEREGFVVVFPQGRFDPVRWDASPTSSPNQDIDFVNTILDTLGDDLCLDERRVYAAGLSYGAFMTSLVTCKLSDRFAAVAPVAGLRLLDPCPQTRQVPIVTFHGTLDTFVPFGPTPGIVAGWAARNGCNATPTETTVSAEVTHRVFDCPAGADVELFVVTGGGHTWPGSAFSQAIASYVGYTTFDIDASEEAWRFFQRFQLPCPTGETCDEPADPSESTSTTTAAVSAASAGAAPAVSPSFTG